MEFNQSINNTINNESSNEHISFRGNPIPEIFPKDNFQVADSSQVIQKINNMSDSERKSVTIDSVHFDRGLSDVKLSTGDIVPVETAIALAENNMLAGYSTGSTMRGGRILRSKPSTNRANQEAKGIYDLPRF